MIPEFAGQEPHEYLGSVERRYGDEVESGEHYVHPGREIEHCMEGTEIVILGEAHEEESNEGEDGVCRDAGGRHEDHALSEVAQVEEIDGHRFCPPETEDQKRDGAERIEMFSGVQGKSSQPFCRGISHPVRHPSVRQFVNDDGVQEGDDEKKKRQGVAKEKLDKSHGEVRYNIPQMAGDCK